MSHTAEPWQLEIESDGSIWILEANGNRGIAKVLHGRSDAKECAERIVTCVNACAGLDTDMLKDGWTIDQAKEFNKANQERNKTIEALASLVKSLDRVPLDVHALLQLDVCKQIIEGSKP